MAIVSDYRILLEKILVSDKQNIFRVQNEKVISLIQIMFIEENKIKNYLKPNNKFNNRKRKCNYLKPNKFYSTKRKFNYLKH